MRRLLNIIDHSALYDRPALVISLDAEKAFDRVEWPYLFSVLKKFNVGDKCIGWIKSIYSNPQAQICLINLAYIGVVGRDALSPFLFNLAIEPLAEDIRISNKISGIGIENGKQNFTVC